jgi:hypothetical protein
VYLTLFFPPFHLVVEIGTEKALPIVVAGRFDVVERLAESLFPRLSVEPVQIGVVE